MILLYILAWYIFGLVFTILVNVKHYKNEDVTVQDLMVSILGPILVIMFVFYFIADCPDKVIFSFRKKE